MRAIKSLSVLFLAVSMLTPAIVSAGGPADPKKSSGGASATAGAVAVSGSSATAKGGNASATGGNASATGAIGINQQGQSQKQQQGQSQGQAQQIEDSANNAGNNQKVHFDGTSFDRYAPSIAAPALTSGGIGICLGSFSAGLTGPMAGIAFGKTTQDKGCAQARDSMILHNMGYKGAALRVLAGESIEDALAAEGLLPAKKSAAKKVEAAPVAAVETPSDVVVSSSNFGARGVDQQGN